MITTEITCCTLDFHFFFQFVLIVVILIKRQILRMLLISKRGPHTTVGAGAPQLLAREIEIRLRRIARLRIEPKMMAEQFNKPSEVTNDFDSPPGMVVITFTLHIVVINNKSLTTL